MIQIRDLPLPDEAAKALAAYQAFVDDAPDYETRVERAKKHFSQQNKNRNPTFVAVKATLTAMCAGARRCMYCEDSMADEVEHFRPKDLYPELVFAWSNYLYACGPCNGPKNNQFQVFAADGSAMDVGRKRGAAVEPPTPGDPIPIDPRSEDPLSFLFLDLRGTFEYVPALGLSARDNVRAVYTTSLLGLNREVVRNGRRGALKHYLALFEKYVRAKEDGATVEALKSWEDGIRRETGHPTVWAELKRQRALLGAPVATLFERAPEALDW